MEDKKHSFMDQLNLFFIGAVIGVIVGACTNTDGTLFIPSVSGKSYTKINNV